MTWGTGFPQDNLWGGGGRQRISSHFFRSPRASEILTFQVKTIRAEEGLKCDSRKITLGLQFNCNLLWSFFFFFTSEPAVDLKHSHKPLWRYHCSCKKIREKKMKTQALLCNLNYNLPLSSLPYQQKKWLVWTRQIGISARRPKNQTPEQRSHCT